MKLLLEESRKDCSEAREKLANLIKELTEANETLRQHEVDNYDQNVLEAQLIAAQSQLVEERERLQEANTQVAGLQLELEKRKTSMPPPSVSSSSNSLNLNLYLSLVIYRLPPAQESHVRIEFEMRHIWRFKLAMQR